MKAKVKLTQSLVRMATWGFEKGEETPLMDTMEEQIDHFHSIVSERISPPELAEAVTRNALVQYGLDEALMVLETSDAGNPADYEMGPNDWPPKQERKKRVTEGNQTPEQVPAEPKAPRVRTTRFDEATVRTLVQENWRRPGSHGHTTVQAILDAGGEISGKDLKAAGGRLVDVQWDVNRNPDKLQVIYPE